MHRNHSSSSGKRAPSRFEAKMAHGVSRRTVLAQAITGSIAAATACGGSRDQFVAEFTQKHFTELSPEDKERIFARLEDEARDRYGVDVEIDNPDSIAGVEFAYALNLSKCVGCRRCVYACVRENNPSRSPQIQYIRVLEMEKGSLDVERSDSYYEHEEVPSEGKYYMPVQCQQCRKPPCVKVCPVQATWKEPDGLVVVDYNWCIGCRYCAAACPYWARRFNFSEPSVRPDEINPKQAYLSNRIRPVGVMEKCTFCLQRVRRGRYPACLEACPTGSRKFGNLRDPNSEIREIIKNKRVYVMREDAGTEPRFFYFFD